jgi:hypothetical protein
MSILGSGIYQGYVHSFKDNSLYPFANAQFAKLAAVNATSYLDVSTDGGITFSGYDLIAKIGGGARIITSFDFEDANVAITSRLASPITPKLHVSNDYGFTFTDVTANLPSYNSSYQFTDVVYKSGRLLVQYRNSTNGQSWCYSDDNGASFTNMTTWVSLPSFGVFPTSTAGASAYVDDTLSNDVYKLVTTTWTSGIDPTGAGLANDVIQSRKSLSNPPGSTTVIYGGYRYPTNNDIYISKSSNAGASYAAQKTIAGTFTTSPTIGAASATKVFIEYDSVLYVSTDSGVNFTATAFSADTNAIGFNSSTNGILGVNGGGTYYTLDGGTSWSASTGSAGSSSAEIIRRNTK